MGALDGKVAVVTGASSGTGRAIAARFVEEGARVYLLARDAGRLKAVAGDLGPAAVPVPTDISEAAAVAAAFERIGENDGRVDILINNAAVYRPCRVEHLERRGHPPPDRHQPRRPDRHQPSRRSAAARRRRGRHRQHLQRVDAAPVSDAVDLRGDQDGARSLRRRARPGGRRRRHPGHHPRPGHGPGCRAAARTDWAWDPDHSAEAFRVWTEAGLLAQAFGRNGGQDIAAVADVHLFIVTRPRSQKLDRVHVRSF